MEEAGIDQHLAAWTINCLSDRPQYVRTNGCVSDVVTCSTRAAQGTVLSPFLFTLCTADFSYNSNLCHLQKFFNNSAIVGCISEGDEQEYGGVVLEFVDWREQHLLLNTNKTKELVVDFRRTTQTHTAVSIQCFKIVDSFKYLGVLMNDELDWSSSTTAIYKTGQRCLHLLRRQRSFGVSRALLQTFFMTMWWLLQCATQSCAGGVESQTGTGGKWTHW